MSTETSVKINKEYLREIAQRANVTLKDMSNSLGRGDSFISKSLNRGVMQVQAAKLLCRMYGANFESLVIQNKPQIKTDDSMIETLKRIENKVDFLISQLS